MCGVFNTMCILSLVCVVPSPGFVADTFHLYSSSDKVSLQTGAIVLVRKNKSLFFKLMEGRNLASLITISCMFFSLFRLTISTKRSPSSNTPIPLT
ncbi:hypothetical protein RB195_014057 [Necator americanus]|uniref:Secreted protein n=1 Tax=Necator americanus TaxID=51031 RepID=A0ABR1DYG9_NECAM